MHWRNFQGLQIPLSRPRTHKERYSVTADILSYELCPIQYGMFNRRKYEPAVPVQLFYGTVIHQVLDKAHGHYSGILNPQTRSVVPSDNDIER